jgi:hypothetical protein
VAKRKIRLADNIARVIFVDDEATKGATLGTNLYMADGQVASPALLAAYIGAALGNTTIITGGSSSGGNANHSTLQNLGANDHPQYLLKNVATTEGDLLVRGASAIERLSVGAEEQVLTIVSGLPTWADPGGGGVEYLYELLDVNVYGADDGDVLTYSGGEWVAIPAGGSTAYSVLPTSDLAKTSDTALAADTALDVALVANTSYRIEYMLRIDTAATPDFKWDLNFTGTTTSVFIASDNANVTTASLAAGASASGTGNWLTNAFNVVRAHTIAGTDTMALRIVVNLLVGASGGTLSFRWAQNTSSLTATTRKVGSSVYVVPES